MARLKLFPKAFAEDQLIIRSTYELLEHVAAEVNAGSRHQNVAVEHLEGGGARIGPTVPYDAVAEVGTWTLAPRRRVKNALDRRGL